MRSRFCLIIAVLLMSILFFGFFSLCYSQTVEEKEPQFIFIVRLGQIDWETRALEVLFEVWFNSLPDNFSDIVAMYNFSDTITVHFEQWHNTGEIFLNPQIEFVNGEKKLTSYYGNKPDRFNFRGPTEYYPFDQYMLDTTLSLPSFGIINETNTVLKLEYCIGGFEMRHESADREYTITYEQKEWGEEVSLHSKVFLIRSASSTNLIISVLGICYLLVGSIPLIKPEKIEHRLSVCLSLFLFAVSFTFTISIPTLARTTLAESLIFILLIGAGAFSVVSVIEKAIIEAKQRFAFLQFPIEGVVMFFVLISLSNALTSLISPQLATEFPWVSLPPYLFISLIISLLYGYISVTFIFMLNLIKKD